MEEDGVPALRVSEGLAMLKAKAVFDSLSDEEKERVNEEDIDIIVLDSISDVDTVL